MKRLRVRCLGGFEVWYGDGQVTSFESQKTKALLAYFLSHRGRAFARERLAALLWPETSEESARRNLRQAVYSLKRTLPDQGEAPIAAAGGQLRWNPAYECEYDVETFERDLDRAHSGDLPDPHSLATAVDLYRGDFLAGVLVKDSEAFDLWMTAEQDRLRDRVLEALRLLVESYLARGEYRFGVRYARRLIAVDPLAEEAYRYLMQLYALSGRRNQALAQYEELRELLRSHMGVEPLAETEALYQAISRSESPLISAASDREDPIGPLVPLVGRREVCRELEQDPAEEAAGRVRLALVTGEAGVGKSRVVKSFLGSTSAGTGVTVLEGRCFLTGPALYQPFPQLLGNALTGDSESAERALRRAPPELIAELSPLVPGLGHLRPDVTPPSEPVRRERLYEAAVRALRMLADSGEVVIFLDDLHLAGPETFDLLDHLRERLDGRRVRIIAAYRGDVARPEPLRRLEEETRRPGAVRRIVVERLDPAAVEEIAAALVGGEQTAELARFLVRWGEGLPIAMAEAINFLWDEGVLVPGEAGRWNLTRSLRDVTLPDSGSFLDLVVRRFRRLPSSTRRLAVLAAVAGQKFDTELLRKAADELDAVVEVSLELLLERWLIRRSAEGWVSSGRKRCIVLWTQGAKRGSFEFAHELTWRAIYEELDPRRREVLHGEVARTLEKLYEGTDAEGDVHDAEGYCETLGRHFAEAGVWDRALHYYRRAARRARHLGAREAALSYDGRCLEAKERLASSGDRISAS